MISKRRLVTGFAVLGLVGIYVLPFIVYEDPYGEVPIPGSATLHLPAGEADLTLRSVGSLEGQPVPPLSIQISGPDGLLQPEVAESRRTKYFTAEDTWVRLWVDTAEHVWDSHGMPTGQRQVAAVCLDVAAARQLAADLSAWVDEPHVEPTNDL